MIRHLSVINPPPADPQARRRFWADLPNHGDMVWISGQGLHVASPDAIMDVLGDPVFLHGVDDCDQLAADREQDRRYRSSLLDIFTRLGPRVPELRASARELIESVAPKGHCEAKALGIEYASIVLWRLLDFPPETRDQLKICDGPGFSRFEPNTKAAIAPCADRLKELTGISDHDAHRILITLINAAIRTTASAVALALRELADRPDLREHLRDHPGDVAAYSHEIVRLDPPLPVVVRNPSRQVDLCGVRIPAGTRIWLPLATANTHHSAAITITNDKIHPRKGFSFSHGPRRCIGASLAQLELKLFIGEFLKATNYDFLLAKPYSERPSRRGEPLSREVGEVHLRWQP